MKYTLLSLIILCSVINNASGQSDHYIKLDVLRATLSSLGLTYETRNEKRGLEVELIYDWRSAVVSQWPMYDPVTMMYDNNFDRYEFDQTRIEIIFSYKRYISLFKRPDRAYWGIYNRNEFLLNRDEAYYSKYEEVHGFERTREKTFSTLGIGPTFGLSIPIGDHFRVEMGLGIGINLLYSSDYGGISFVAHAPILIGYKF